MVFSRLESYTFQHRLGNVIFLQPMAADVSSQVCRMVALQDLLGAFPNQSGETGDALTASILVGLSTLVPDEVLQHALQIVDTNGVTCVQSETGRKVLQHALQIVDTNG